VCACLGSRARQAAMAGAIAPDSSSCNALSDRVLQGPLRPVPRPQSGSGRPRERPPSLRRPFKLFFYHHRINSTIVSHRCRCRCCRPQGAHLSLITVAHNSSHRSLCLCDATYGIWRGALSDAFGVRACRAHGLRPRHQKQYVLYKIQYIIRIIQDTWPFPVYY
jgi:hypothetical protein